MPQVARLGDSSDHGGHIVSASGDTSANGIRIARIGDMHSCPILGHGTTALVSTPNHSVKNNGKLVAVIGAQAGCGATIIQGSPDVKAQDH